MTPLFWGRKPVLFMGGVVLPFALPVSMVLDWESIVVAIEELISLLVDDSLAEV